MTAFVEKNFVKHEKDWGIKIPGKWNDDQFFEFCQENKQYRIERDAKGTIYLMPPTGLETGDKNIHLGTDLNLWRRKNTNGKVGDSSTGYILPNGATRSPDASFISNERLSSLTPEQIKKFPPASPEFVAEIRSPSDSLLQLKEKMREYIENEVLLAWLFDMQNQHVYIYRADGSIELVKNFDGILSGEDVLPGFEFELKWMK